MRRATRRGGKRLGVRGAIGWEQEEGFEEDSKKGHGTTIDPLWTPYGPPRDPLGTP